MALLSRALKNAIRWCKVSRDGDEAAERPVQQVTYMGKVGDALMWFPYGYHANVPAGELALMLGMQGNPEARVALPGSPTDRPTDLLPGEVVLFHPGSGSRVHLKNTGEIEISAQSPVDVNATGDVNVTAGGDATVTAAVDASVTAAGGIAKLEGDTVVIKSTSGDILMEAATFLEIEALSGDARVFASVDVELGLRAASKTGVRVAAGGGTFSTSVFGST